MWSDANVLVVVRHGRTAANAAGLLLGHLDPPLDEVGAEQADLLAKAVGRVDRVVSSPLARARSTAERFGLPVEIEPRWIELDYGEFDGKRFADVGAEVWHRWHHDMDYEPPGGESLAAMQQRVVGACEDLLAEAAEREVVVVSHVSPIKAAVAWALGVGVETAWRSHLDQASITRIGVGPRGPVLRSFNETQHLGPLATMRLTG